jgi:cardiolipin synthase A/B
MLEAGIRIFEYQPTMIHQKLVVIDGKLSIVGSANLDVRSKELNQENALVLLDQSASRRRWRGRSSTTSPAPEEVHLETFRRRPVGHRVVEALASLFEEQF